MTKRQYSFGAEQIGAPDGEDEKETESMQNQIAALLTETLNLGRRGEQLTADSPLLGSLPEFDSMAVVTVITQLEELFGLEFDDDDITAESFATVGALVQLVESKLE